MNKRTDEERRLATLSNAEVVEALAEGVTEEMWVEVALRLGVEGVNGIRAAAVPSAGIGRQAERLRRYMALWEGQPEASP